LAGETKENHENQRVADVSAEIHTENFPNAGLEGYRCATLPDGTTPMTKLNLLLALCIFDPEDGGQYFTPKNRRAFTGLYGFTTQKMVLFTFSSLRLFG
jgi:hypothetical protein